jgi:hypothetical protein
MIGKQASTWEGAQHHHLASGKGKPNPQ